MLGHIQDVYCAEAGRVSRQFRALTQLTLLFSLEHIHIPPTTPGEMLHTVNNVRQMLESDF